MALLKRNRGRALTAAAEQLDLNDRNEAQRIKKRQQTWQKQAWDMYDQIPELWFAHNYVANALRRVRIFAATQPDQSEAPIPLDPDEDGPLAVRAALEMRRLSGDDGGHGELLHDTALQLCIPGECFLVGDIDPETGEEAFDIYATDELLWSEKGWSIKDGPDDKVGTPLGASAIVNRIWRQHPRWRNWADSGMRPNIELCEDLLMRQRWSRSAGRSRLNAGAWFLPSEADWKPAMPGSGQFGQIQGMSPFVASILDAWSAPINDEGAATAVVPAIFEMKGEFIEKILHMDFGRDYDDQAQAREEKLLQRIASGLDIPSEVITGLADLNHWTAWQVDEDTYKAHLEPLLVLMVSGYTKAFLRPAMADVVQPDPVMVWFDPSALIANPNRQDSLKDAHQALVISDEAYRRYAGFTEEDAPDDDEVQRRQERAVATTPNGNGSVGQPNSPAATEDANANPGAPDGEASARVRPFDGEFTQSELQAEQSLVASAAEDLRRLARQLATVDFELRQELQAVIEAAISRVAVASGQQLRQHTRGTDWEIALMQGNIRDRDIAAFMTPAAARSFFDFDSAVEDAMTWLVSAYTSLVAAAQTKVRRLFSRYSVDETALLAQQVLDRESGEAMLRSQVPELMNRQLFTPSSEVTVPPELVRNITERAGGSLGGAVELPDGGVATGPTAVDSMIRRGFTRAGYEWRYGDETRPGGPFPPHKDLDGVEFHTWDDDKLKVPADYAWMKISHFHPGDHKGCRCDAGPIFEDRSN